MEKIYKYLKKLSTERDYQYFQCEKTGEVWVSGYLDSEKFDIVVRPYRRFQVKVVFETPDERKVMLFPNKIDAYRRVKSFFEEKKEDKRELLEVGNET